MAWLAVCGDWERNMTGNFVNALRQTSAIQTAAATGYKIEVQLEVDHNAKLAAKGALKTE